MDLNRLQLAVADLNDNASQEEQMGLNWQSIAREPTLPRDFKLRLNKLGTELSLSNRDLDAELSDLSNLTDELGTLLMEILEKMPGVKSAVQTNVKKDTGIAKKMAQLIREYEEDVDPKILAKLREDVEKINVNNPQLLNSFENVEGTANDTDSWGDTARVWGLRLGFLAALTQAASCFGVEKQQTILGWAGDKLLTEISEQVEK